LTTTGTTAIATWTAPTATDNCSTTSISSTYKSGTAFPIGTTVVTYTAADTKLNKSTCSFTVKVSKALFDVTNNNALLELSAKADLNDIKLAWVNNTGDKNDYFEVQKLNKNSGDFEKIALINSLSTTKTEYYTAADANPVDGENVYRINLVATDGSQKVSNTSVVNFYKTADVGIFPNPTSDYVDIDLQHYEGQAATLYIYNNFGYLIQTKSIERVSKTPIHIDFDQPSSGQYLLRVVSQGRKDVVKKFMVQH
jgi:hypothetical protein